MFPMILVPLRRLLFALVFALAATLPALPILADEEGTAGNLRFAASPAGPWVADSVVFDGDAVSKVVVAFDYTNADNEPIGLQVIAPGGLQVHRSNKTYSGSGVATIEVSGIGIYRNLSQDIQDTLRSSRGDADRLAAARFGLQEYILQLQANATRTRSALEVLQRIALPGNMAEHRRILDETVKGFSRRTAEARATDPNDVEKIQSLARTIAEELGKGIPSATALQAHAAGTTEMPIPANDRRSDQPYDVLISVDDFTAASGEFRIYPPVRIHLPFLAQRDLTR
jgi:hypothetical protein